MMNKIYRHIKIFWLFGLLAFFQSCSSGYLYVHTDYLSHENLASFHVGSPDPALENPTVGQQLIISWTIPKQFLEYENLHLNITIRYHNMQEVIFNVCIDKITGLYIYSLLNEEYFAVKGIQTYKVDLIGSGCLLEQWRHQMWIDLIKFENTENKDE